MMRLLYKFAILLALVTVIVSCTKPAEPSPQQEEPAANDVEQESENDHNQSIDNDHEPSEIIEDYYEHPLDLHVTYMDTDRGFILQYDKLAGVNSYIDNTILSPKHNDQQYVVHSHRRIIDQGSISLFTKDMIVVNPNTQDYHIVPLFQAYVDDAYSVSSIAEIYSFIDAEHIAYVSVTGDDMATGAFIYGVEKVNIMTGAKETIVAELPEVDYDVGYWRGWFNQSRTTLNLIGTLGKLWTIYLDSGEVELSAQYYRDSWPFFNSVPSPDGERFWYTDYDTQTYQLYDKHGEFIAESSFGQGFEPYPAFIWHQDGQFAAYSYTNDEDRNHVVMEGEMYDFAPQGIDFYDKKGKKIYDVEVGEYDLDYVEVTGWLPNADEVVLHYYNLERFGHEDYGQPLAAKIDSQYQLLNLSSGHSRELTIAEDVSSLNEAELIYPADKQFVYFIDRTDDHIWISEELAKIVSDPTHDPVTWVSGGYEQGDLTTWHELERQTNKYDSRTLNAVYSDFHWARSTEDGWLVYGKENNIIYERR